MSRIPFQQLTSTGLATLGLVLTLVSAVDAQIEVKRRTTAPGTPTAAAPSAAVDVGSQNVAAAAVNPDIKALATGSDLTVRRLGFDGKGNITFELRNRGQVPINYGEAGEAGEIAAATTVQKAQPVPENKQIQVVVYLGNTPFRTVFQPRLGGGKSKTFNLALPENSRPRCAESRALKTVIDPGNVIVEVTDTNNVDTVTAARPCPDLAIKSITKNTNKYKTEFVARVTVINQGNAPVERFDYLAMEALGSGPGDYGDHDDESGGPLAPGETMKFNVGSALAHENLQVEVLLDRHRLVEELDESNNYRKKTVN